MSLNQEPQAKKSQLVDKPFPWRCRQCGKTEVVMTTTEYQAEVRCDGQLYQLQIPHLEIPVCQICGAKVFTEAVDAQVDEALIELFNLIRSSDT